MPRRHEPESQGWVGSGRAQSSAWGLCLQASLGVWAALPSRQRVPGIRMGKGLASGMPSRTAGRGRCLVMRQQMWRVMATTRSR